MVYEGLHSKIKKNTISIDALLFMLYYLIAPFEDIFSFQIGTVAKYIAILLVFIFILKNIKDPIKFRVSEPTFFIPILLVALGWFSLLWSVNLRVTLSRNIAYTLLPGLFLIAKIKKFNDREIKLIETAVILSGILMVLYVFFNYKEFLSGSYGRFTISEGNDPNNLAAHLILPLFLVIGLNMQSNRKFSINILLIGALLYSIFLTGSRGAFIAILTSLLYLQHLFYKGKKKYKAIIAIIFFAIIVLGIIRFLPDNIVTRIFSINAYIRDFGAHESRSTIWKNTIKYIIPIMPPWGYGSGTAGEIVVRIYGHIKGIHNTYLNMIVEFGLFGLPLFILFLYKMFQNIKNSNKKYYIGAFIAMLVIIFFLDSYSKKYFWNVLMFFVISILKNKRGLSDVKEGK